METFKINIKTLPSGTTANYLSVPIMLESQEIGQQELIDKVFVDVQVENAINPIVDYDKVKFLPIDNSNPNNVLTHIMYNLTLLSGTTFHDVGFTDKDISLNKSAFKETFLYLAFYDDKNPLTQRLVSYTTLFASLLSNDLLPSYQQQLASPLGIVGSPGQPKPASQINLQFSTFNPIHYPLNLAEGYYLYDYRDELQIGQWKYLYMRASFKNAKTGKSTNLMVKNTPQTIDLLVNELYTRFKLIRLTDGYYYQLDDTYQGNGPANVNNVSFVGTEAIINLYEIQSS